VPHCAPAGFVQDGLYLRHVEGHYDAGEGATPLALLWKDEDCSRYLLVSPGEALVAWGWGSAHALTLVCVYMYLCVCVCVTDGVYLYVN
jgi:hypothetical protein